MRKRRGWLLLGAFLMAIIASISAGFFRRANRLPHFLANRTQGYERYVLASDEIAGRPGGLTNGFPDFVAMNKRAYDAIDAAAKEEIEAPPHAYNAATLQVTEHMGLRKIGQALEARSRAAQADGQLDQAMNDCFAAIRFGQKVEHGPVINFMVGSAIEWSATTRLVELAPMLSETDLSQATKTLRQLNRARLPFSEVKRRERYFMSQNETNLIQGIREMFSSSAREMFKKAEQRSLSTSARIEILAVLLAARQFEINRNAAPASARDLIPQFLDSPPIDPYTKKELRWRNSGGAFAIYSVGANRRDDLGQGDDVTLEFKDSAGMNLLINSLNKMAE